MQTDCRQHSAISMNESVNEHNPRKLVASWLLSGNIPIEKASEPKSNRYEIFTDLLNRWQSTTFLWDREIPSFFTIQHNKDDQLTSCRCLLVTRKWTSRVKIQNQTWKQLVEKCKVISWSTERQLAVLKHYQTNLFGFSFQGFARPTVLQ